MMECMWRVALLAGISVWGLAYAQDLPAGTGKDLVLRLCVECHDTQTITTQHATRDGWASIVDTMVVRGAGGTKEELATVVDYLAKNFPQEPAKAGKTSRYCWTAGAAWLAKSSKDCCGL